MTALAATRLTQSQLVDGEKAFLAADSQTFFHGGLVMLDSAGLLRPAAALASNRGFVGVANLTPSGGFPDGSKASGTGGDVKIPVLSGVFRFAGDTLAQTIVGIELFADDDQTVDETQASNAPGKLLGVEFVSSSEAWVSASWKNLL